MTLFQAPFGTTEPRLTILSTTTSTIVLPSDKNKQAVAKIHICNVSVGAVTVDIEDYDGTTIFYLEKGQPLAASGAINSSFELRDHMLGAGRELRVKASAANALHVTVIHALSDRNT